MSELTSDCTLHHTRVMVRISRHATVNIKVLAKCGELDTKLSVSLVQHTFFESQIQKWERAAGLDRGHFDGGIPTIQQTLQLVD